MSGLNGEVSVVKNEAESQYSSTVGMVFIFNLIVGTGALAMPGAFHQAGWLLSLILVIVIAFTSYITVTFIIESMACANAIMKHKRRGSDTVPTINGDFASSMLASSVTETTALLNENTDDDFFRIRQRVELGQMVSMFFNKFGVVIFYICMIVYLYGDLAIYAVAVPKSLRDVICVYKPPSVNCSIGWNESALTDMTQCFPGVSSIDRMLAYRLCVLLFFLALGPFVFFNVQKTMLLQVITTLLRWIAFLSMISLAVYELSVKGRQGQPKMADFSEVPTLFGVCVYAFMCHHSLPSLVTPIKHKEKLSLLISLDYGLILCFYTLLSLTAVFAFNHIPDLYTLTFEPSFCPKADNPAPLFFQYFLALFPVFTISASFPIIGITLRNNLKALCLKETRKYSFIVRRLLFPFLVLLPPLAIALSTTQVGFLVGITGSYAGSALQYTIPVALVYFARKKVRLVFGPNISHKSESFFKHFLWLILLLIWALACVVFVTIKHITSKA